MRPTATDVRRRFVASAVGPTDTRSSSERPRSQHRCPREHGGFLARISGKGDVAGGRLVGGPHRGAGFEDPAAPPRTPPKALLRMPTPRLTRPRAAGPFSQVLARPSTPRVEGAASENGRPLVRLDLGRRSARPSRRVSNFCAVDIRPHSSGFLARLDVRFPPPRTWDFTHRLASSSSTVDGPLNWGAPTLCPPPPTVHNPVHITPAGRRSRDFSQPGPSDLLPPDLWDRNNSGTR